MLLSRLLANFTRGQSDTLRKAMGKKLIEKMNELKGLFIQGGTANGHDAKVLEKIWADWEKFASYAFNKSHATCYSWVAFQTAYLKANYPAEYMAAVLTRNLSDLTKLTGFMDECKRMHISVKGPDVNESYAGFGVNSHGDIRFGLAAVKGVGEGVVADIIREREANGPYESIYDFVERVNPSTLNRRVLEALALSGALDCFGSEVQREDYYATNGRGESFMEQLLRYGQAYQQDKVESAASLFGDDEGACSTAGRPPITHAVRWPDTVRLDKERDLVGMYLSAHPLDPYYLELQYGCTCDFKHFAELGANFEGQEITLGGMVVSLESRPSKSGSMFGILKVEDYSGSHEFMLFGQDYIDFHNYGVTGTPIYIKGAYERRYKNQELRFNIKSIQLLETVKGSLVSNVHLKLFDKDINPRIRGLLAEHMTDDPDGGNLEMTFMSTQLKRRVRLSASRKVKITRAFLDLLVEEGLEFEVY